MPNNPYAARKDRSFWSRSVAHRPIESVDPAVDLRLRIDRSDRVATAGSCFAQHISKYLAQSGYDYLVTERAPPQGGENYGVFPARFANVYTARQLRQLFDRAYGLFSPADTAWTRHDDALVDPFRPRIQRAGFSTGEELAADRRAHLACVRRMFEECDVFIFTLGLTEAWISTVDGAVFPLAPGVAGGDCTDLYAFKNFSVTEVVDDLNVFIRKFRRVNASARIVFTVSPVPLKATYEDRHVLLSTTYSKSVLRVAAETICRSTQNTFYFPSFEIINLGGERFFQDDRREVSPGGVAHVMSIFSRNCLSDGSVDGQGGQKPAAHAGYTAPVQLSDADRIYFEETAAIVCDEDALDNAAH